MVRCIVKSCRNQTDTCCKTEVSFFSLPKNDVIREGWLRKIGEVSSTLNIKSAKICSIHFTKESFHVGRRQKAGKCLNSRRLLLPNAFPTIMLSSRENRRDTVSMDFKIIRREFLLSANRNIDEGSSSNENLINNKNPDLNISDTVVNIGTPKSHVRGKIWVNENLFETPQNTSDVSDKVCSATFPRRSQGVKHFHCRIESLLNMQMKRQVTAPVLKNLKMPRKLFREYHSEENTPSCICKHRFVMENCTNNVSTHNSGENEEPHTSMKSQKAELEHHRCVNKFHLESRCNNTDQIQDIKIECQSLRSELIQKNEEIQNLIQERGRMLKTINDLQLKLVAADLDKHNLKQTFEDKMIQILQRYFTEGQIRCILENRKYVRWSIDDYASAISFRSVSPKAYRYFQSKLNFPLPSLSSLKKWTLKKFDVQEGLLSDVQLGK